MGPLTRSSEGYQFLIIFIDLNTSWPESIPLRTSTAEELSFEFQRIIIARHVCPDNVLTDKGTNFTSKLFKQICAQYKIRHLLSTAYHHQTKGKVERFNKFMENSLSTMFKKDQTDWPKYVESCLFIYRTTFNRALKETLFFLMYVRDPVMPQDLLIPLSERQNKTEDLDIYKTRLLQVLRKTYDSLNDFKRQYQNKYKKYYDKNKRPVQFEVGDKVRVYFLTPEKEGLKYKLGVRWRGPFRIVAQLDPTTYRVRKEEANRVATFPVHVQRQTNVGKKDN
jgi:transposase InsO family protein